MNLKYIAGAAISIPLLPLMYYQGKKIRAEVPQLPEAEGKTGQCIVNNQSANDLKVIFIGESTIAGVGVQTHEEGFAGAFAKTFSRFIEKNVIWKVYARSGYTAKSVHRKLLPKITEKQADLIVVGLGGNDAFTLNKPSNWSKDIRAIIESLQQIYPQTRIVFCNMPPIKEFPAFTSLIKFTIGNLVELLGEELEKVVKDYENVYYYNEIISVRQWKSRYQIEGDQSKFFSDGVHPSKLTYQTWGKAVAQFCFELGLEK
jgi:lysophospholipase L1-like esterase